MAKKAIIWDDPITNERMYVSEKDLKKIEIYLMNQNTQRPLTNSSLIDGGSSYETLAITGSQTKIQSLTEAFVNIAVGFGISLITTIIVFPLMDIESTTSKNLQVTLIFTVISILRSYGLRRYFNGSHHLVVKAKFNQALKFMEGLAKDCPNETKW